MTILPASEPSYVDVPEVAPRKLARNATGADRVFELGASAIGATGVDIDDEHAVIENEVGFVGAWLDPADVEPYLEWPLPTERPALAQGSIAGVPAKLWLPADGEALVITAAAYATELMSRLR